jgi:SagB-type dehydrogenase family enzyme
MDEINQNRRFMHCPDFKGIMEASDQQRGIPNPPHSKPVTGELILLPPFENAVVRGAYADLLDIRRSERVYDEEPMTQAQLAFLLWSAQGVQSYRNNTRVATLRPVPSGGSRHPFELYAAVKNVEGLKPGLYRYAPMEHIGEKRASVEFIGTFDDYETRMSELLAGQKWAAKAQAVLFFSCVPYRAEWRYTTAAHRVMLIDLGHAGQNVMLSAAALGLGSCCIAAFDQALCDGAFGLDGIDEYIVYAITAGSCVNQYRRSPVSSQRRGRASKINN